MIKKYSYLNDNNLLAEQQFHFHKLHSTGYAEVKSIDHVAKQMESLRPIQKLST